LKQTRSLSERMFASIFFGISKFGTKFYFFSILSVLVLMDIFFHSSHEIVHLTRIRIESESKKTRLDVTDKPLIFLGDVI